MDRLEFWTQQSVTVPQELEMVRDRLNDFLVSLNKNLSHLFMYQVAKWASTVIRLY